MTIVVGALFSSAAYFGYSLKPDGNNELLVSHWQSEIQKQKVNLKNLKEEADADIDVMSSRLGLLQAHVMRLDALGRKLTNNGEN